MSQTHTIKWILFHQPVDLFLRTAVAFRDEIKQLTDSRINIEIYTLQDYCDKFHKGIRIDIMSLINTGEVQMSQMQVNKLGQYNAEDFHALEMPFLFTDHDHAARVLEGDIGRSLLDDLLPSKTNVKGLAFTYSGGYRVIASQEQIKTIEDLQKTEMTMGLNPIFVDMAKAIGCKYSVVCENDEEERFKKVTASNAVQTTLPRYQTETDPQIHKYVTNTKHSMFLTTIVINNDFWNNLSIEDQTHIKTAALNSSRLERAWSIADADKIENDKQEQKKLGIVEFNDLPETELLKLKNKIKPVYEKYQNIFTTGLIEKILKS